MDDRISAGSGDFWPFNVGGECILLSSFRDETMKPSRENVCVTPGIEPVIDCEAEAIVMNYQDASAVKGWRDSLVLNLSDSLGQAGVRESTLS